MFAYLEADLLVADVQLGRHTSGHQFLLHFAGIVVGRAGDGADSHRYRRQPQRQVAGSGFDQDAQEALQGTQHRTVQHHRTLAGAVFGHVFRIQTLGQHEVHLQGAALPVTANGVTQYEFQFRAVEGTFTRVQFALQTQGFHRLSQRAFGLVPGLVGAGTVVRAIGELDAEGFETEVLVDLAQHGDKAGGFHIDLLFSTEDVGIILAEGAGTHQAVQGTVGFITEQGGELAETNWQVPVALDALVEDLHVARAVHGLHGHLAVVVGTDGEHVIAVFVPVAGLFPEDAVHHLRRGDFLVAAFFHLAADVVFQVLAHAPAFRVPEHAAHRFLLDMEQAHFLGQFAVVTLFRFLKLLEVGVQFFLVAPGGAVDALQLGLGGIATPVGAGHLGQLETIAQLAGAGQVRAAAQVDEIALAVQAHFLVGGQITDDLGLELFAGFQEELHRFVAVPYFTADVLVAAHNVLHALFDGLQIIRSERFSTMEVVVEAVFDGRANGHLGVGEQFLNGFSHDVGCIVTNQLQGVVGVAGDDLHRGAIVDGQINVDQVAVDLGGQGLFGEFFADATGNIQCGGRLIKLHGCPIGQLVAHTHG